MLTNNDYKELLILEKSILELSLWGTIECANVKVRKTINNILNTNLDLQNDIFTYMTKLGMYNIKNISSKTINDELYKLKTA